MSFDLTPTIPVSALFRRDERLASRELARLESRAALQVAGVRAAEAVACAKLEAIGAVGTVALEEIADVSLREAMRAAQNPRAAGRLAFVADQAAMALGARLRRFERLLG